MTGYIELCCIITALQLGVAAEYLYTYSVTVTVNRGDFGQQGDFGQFFNTSVLSLYREFQDALIMS